MIICMASSEPSEGEPLASETAASKDLQSIARKGTGRFGAERQKSIRRQQRIFSVKGLTTQRMHRKVFGSLQTDTAASRPQPFYVASAHSPHGLCNS